MKPILRVVTNSESDLFACRRLWHFSAVEGLTRSNTPAPLRQGSLVARCIEHWALAGSRATFDEIDCAVVVPWIEGREQALADGAPWYNQERLDEDLELARQSRAMIRGYVKRWASDADEWETIAVEAQVFRWLVHPDTQLPIVDVVEVAAGAAGGPPTRRPRRWGYGGKLDRLVRHRERGDVWALETKTTAETNLDSYCRKLHFDPQTRGYGWSLAEPEPAHTTAAVLDACGALRGIRVAGVIYDVLRKATPEEPTLVQKGDRLVKASTLTTDYDTYLAAVLKHGFNPDLPVYRDQLDVLAKQRWFHREPYPFSDREVEDFGNDAAYRALEMIDEERKPFHTRSLRVCCGFNRGCPGGFESICMADGAMARRSYGRATVRHAELTGDLAEPLTERAREAAPVDEPPAPDLFADVDADSAGGRIDLGPAHSAGQDDDATKHDDDDDLFGPGAGDDAGQ